MGYEDINDQDDLRCDPALALFVDRLEPKALIVHPLNHLEHAPSGADSGHSRQHSLRRC